MTSKPSILPSAKRRSLDALASVQRFSGLGSHAFCVVAGLAAALLLLCVGALVLAERGYEQHERWHHRDITLLDGLTSEAKALFTTLNEHDWLQCTSDDQRSIRGLVFDAIYFREVGVLDADGRLVCTSTDDVLEGPVKGGGVAYRASSGLEFAPDVGLIFSKTGLRSTVVSSGRYNLVVAPRLERDLRTAGPPLKFVRGPDGLSPMWGGRASPVGPAAGAGMPGRAVDLSRARFTLASEAGAGDFWLSSHWTPGDLVAAHKPLAVLVLLSSLLVGVLAGVGLTYALKRRASLDHRVHGWLERGEIRCMYQPIVELANGRVAGCEVLMRFCAHTGLLSPEEAIPAVLRQGLAWRMDQLVSRKALSEVQHALGQRPGFRIALNFFASSLDAERIKASIGGEVARLAEQGIEVEIEVTEHAFSSNAFEQARALQASGFGIAIDDFGTGYSNLDAIRRISPDYIKIDRSFVHDMEKKSARASMIPVIADIASRVGAAVVAEGIENAQQKALLREQGIAFGQGYHFARPMPIEALVEYLGAREAATTKEAVSPALG